MIALRPTTPLTGVARVTLGRWDDIHEWRKNGWIYRGHREEFWSLQTALERTHPMKGSVNLPPRKREHALLREFQRRYYHYSDYIPRRTDRLEWLSIMQHHGTPTRLLDWSYSIYVAAFFALENATDSCAVWALNTKWTYDTCKNLFRSQTEKRFVSERIQDSTAHHNLFKKLFIVNEYRKLFVCPFAPFRLNERLTVQKGLFVIPANISRSFEENLAHMTGYDRKTNLVKIVIPQTLREKAIESLFYMNVSRATLFPGLDGFAQSLALYHPDFHASGN